MGRKDRSDKVLPRPDFNALYRIEGRRFALWLPVALGVGIWLYFDAESEPGWRWALTAVAPLLLLASGWARRIGWGMLALSWTGLVVALGFGAAAASAHWADAPVIRYPLGKTVEGRVIELSRSASGAPRLLLDRVTIYGVEPKDTPARVRLTVLADVAGALPLPGERVRVYASLLPAGGPVEPGAFDFRRRAFFERLGGIGLTRGHLIRLSANPAAGPADRAYVWLARLRDRISRHLREVLPGREGAFAAAIIVGDRSDIDEADAEALRASNLAHLLAISGLHMGMLTGLVFALARVLFALIPFTAYRLSTRKSAAIVALMAGAGYLALSGATVATQRAFIMVAFAFLAVLADRPAITLRALALAAAVILLIRPVSLLDAGFQMSFAATAALVAGYEVLRLRAPFRRSEGSLTRTAPRMAAIYLGALVFSSLLAGLATAPIAAYHFNRTAPYGLLSNLLALPVMGFWIAPWACIAAVLAPFGLAEPALQAMGAGIECVLRIAHSVAALPGAVQPVRAAPGIVLGLIALGGLWLALWRGPWRLGGLMAVAAGMVLWAHPPPRPDVLIAPEAKLIGVMGPGGRVLDHGRAQGFAAETWLRRDGDMSAQETAAARPGLTRSKGRLTVPLADGWRLEVLWQKKPPSQLLTELCQPDTVLIARHGPRRSGPCRYFGKEELRRAGALALSVRAGEVVVDTAEAEGLGRLWTVGRR